MADKSPFKALPGYIICKPYVDKDQTFVSAKEQAGFSQVSEVLDVGGEYIDDHGNLRKSPIKVGDIIFHKYTPEEREINFDVYRAVHFSQVIGVKK